MITCLFAYIMSQMMPVQTAGVSIIMHNQGVAQRLLPFVKTETLTRHIVVERQVTVLLPPPRLVNMNEPVRQCCNPLLLLFCSEGPKSFMNQQTHPTVLHRVAVNTWSLQLAGMLQRFLTENESCLNCMKNQSKAIFNNEVYKA